MASKESGLPGVTVFVREMSSALDVARQRPFNSSLTMHGTNFHDRGTLISDEVAQRQKHGTYK